MGRAPWLAFVSSQQASRPIGVSPVGTSGSSPMFAREWGVYVQMRSLCQKPDSGTVGPS